MGYGDGYPRAVPSGTPVLVNGREVPIVGRVAMDMICVDLGRMPRMPLAIRLCSGGRFAR
jgi:alanine racemase